MTRRHYGGLSLELVAAIEPVLRRHLEQGALRELAATQPAADQLAIADSSRFKPVAKAIYRARRDRDALFGQKSGLFGEPGWDILLDLYRARQEQRFVSVSSACIASAVPPTTGLRHIAALQRHGLVERQYDPFDARRCFVGLTDIGAAIMDRWFARLGAESRTESAVG